MKSKRDEKRHHLEQQLRTILLQELQEAQRWVEQIQRKITALDGRDGEKQAYPSPAQPDTANSKSIAKQLLEIPSVSISEAFRKGMIALREFTRDDVVTWVASNYPSLKFSTKSIGRPLREMIAEGKVIVLRRNDGNKTQTVYGLKAAK